MSRDVSDATDATGVNAITSDLAEWFLNSPIHVGGGAYAQFYTERSVGPVYPEITAYAITLGSLLFARTQRQEFLDRARESAQFMLAAHSPAVAGIDGGHFTFDTAILADGLLTLAAHDPDHRDRWLAAAEVSLDWLSTEFGGGTYPPVIPAVDSDGDKYAWHLTQAVHLNKAAIPLLKGSEALGLKSYVDLSRELLDWSVTLQGEDGALRINESTNRVRFHPHCYALEALLFSGSFLSETRYTEAGRRGADWLVAMQRPDGSFPQWHPQTHGPMRRRIADRITSLAVCDAPAQAIRVWKVLGMAPAHIQRAERFLEEQREDGGLPLQLRHIGPLLVGERRTFSWPTFFYLHACMLDFGKSEQAAELF